MDMRNHERRAHFVKFAMLIGLVLIPPRRGGSGRRGPGIDWTSRAGGRITVGADPPAARRAAPHSADRASADAVTDRPNNPDSGATPGAPGTTSLGLLDGLKGQDPGAWRRLAYLYGPLVYGWCRGRGLRAEDAEDILQEVFLVVAGRIGDYRHDRPGDTF